MKTNLRLLISVLIGAGFLIFPTLALAHQPRVAQSNWQKIPTLKLKTILGQGTDGYARD